MADQVNLVPANDVNGNITSCKIENQLKSVKKDSAFSLTQTNTYITYDVCNKNTIAEYTTPGFAGGAFFWFLIVPILLFAAYGVYSSIRYY